MRALGSNNIGKCTTIYLDESPLLSSCFLTVRPEPPTAKLAEVHLTVLT